MGCRHPYYYDESRHPLYDGDALVVKGHSKEVKQWLCELQLDKYYKLFIRNGFDDMPSVIHIDNINTLETIGIRKAEDRAKIFNDIVRVRNDDLMQKTLKESGLYQILLDNNINLDSLKQDLRDNEIDEFCDELNLNATQRVELLSLLCEIVAPQIEQKYEFHHDHKEMTGSCGQMELVIIGDSGVGKTSLARRYVGNTFDCIASSMGMDTLNVQETLSDDSVMGIKIWDTAGQERYHSICHGYYKRADAIIVCFDVTDKITLKHCASWTEQIDEYGQDHVIVIFVGCKGDLSPNSRQMVETTAQAILNKYGKLYCECSAKTGDNVRNVFLTAELVMRKRKPSTDST